MTTEEQIVSGFLFMNQTDAEKARVDESKIAYIEKNVGYATAGALSTVYEKSIENKIFTTPVGWSFLAEVRNRLKAMEVDVDALSPIPMTVSFSHDPIEIERPAPVKEKRAPLPAMFLSIVFNVILIALVIVMFVVLNTTETDNMLNYKRNITNRYAAWEQDLTERENAVRARERELGITPASGTESTQEP